MHNSLRESFNANRSKLLLALAIIGVTNSALVENLNAQNSNNGAKTEVVNKSDTQRVADFTKPLGVTIPAEWIKFASDNIQMLDQDGIDVAHQLILADFAKIPQQDRLAYVLMAFDAIHKAYDHEEHITAGDAFLDQYLNYENLLIALTKNFGTIWTQRAQTYIAQNNETIKKNNETINKDCYESEQNFLKLYRIAPNDRETKELAEQGKKIFEKYGYKWTKETNAAFTALNIK